MRTIQAYMGSEQSADAPIREMQHVLSRSLPSFYRRAYRYLGNAADAEDAVQDALLSACRHLGQFKGQAQMSTWLTTIVTRACSHYCKDLLLISRQDGDHRSAV